MADQKSYQFDFIKINPNHMHDVKTKMPIALAVLSKMGGKLIGSFACVMGGSFEILNIIEYDSLEPRMKFINEALHHQGPPAEFVKLLGETAKDIQSYICKSVPFNPAMFPIQGYLALRKYEIKGFPVAILNEFKAMQDLAEKKIFGPVGAKLAGGFMPIFGEKAQSYIMLIDYPKSISVDDIAGMGKHFFTDQSIQPQLAKMWEPVHDLSSKLYIPL